MADTQDSWLTETQLVDLLEICRADRPLRAFAHDLGGVPYQMLGEVLARRKAPGTKIPQALGYEAVTLYRRIQPEEPDTKRSNKC